MLKKSILSSFFILIFTAISFTSFAGNFYWVGNSGSWNDAKHWSHNSGDKGGAGIPGINDDVVFDENSFDEPYQQVTINGTANCHGMFWMHEALYATFTVVHFLV